MQPRSVLCLTASCLFPLIACQPTTSAPAALSEQDRAAIQQTVDNMLAAINATPSDPVGYVQAGFAPDAVVLPPNGPIIEGIDAITEFMKALPLSNMQVTLVELEGTSDMAWGRCSWTLTYNPPGAAPIDDVGKCLLIYRKQDDGEWRIVRHMYSSDLPTPAAASASD